MKYKKFLVCLLCIGVFIQPVHARSRTLSKKTIVKELNQIVKNGHYKHKDYYGYCLRFVSDFWADHKVTRSSAGSSIVYCKKMNGMKKWKSIHYNYKKIPVGSDIFFNTKSKEKHVGIYIGNGYFIHAYGDKIRKYHLNHAYYNTTWKKIIMGYTTHQYIKLV